MKRRLPQPYDGGRWKAASRAFLAEHRWCLGCYAALGLRVPAMVTDHVVPHNGDEVLLWCEANWQPACARCHSSVKAELERQWRQRKIRDVDLRLDSPQAKRLIKARHKPRIGLDGYPVEGT